MKIKTISRLEEDFVAAKAGDLVKLPRNPAPELHPFERAREYTRALNATKLDRVFAKPFVRALSGHCDSVYAMARSREVTTAFASGSADGELRVWDLSTGVTRIAAKAHSGFVKGIGFSSGGESIVSCGSDCVVKMWNCVTDDLSGRIDNPSPVSEYVSKHSFLDLDCHWTEPMFATAGLHVDIWSHVRSTPLLSLKWSADTSGCVRFNPVEKHVIATCCDDRAIVLYDVRAGTPIHKTVMAMRCNQMSWNPIEAFNFVAANEDHNLYTFDMRKLSSALCVHKDFVSAVMAVDFAPTGREFVAGSYDRSVRIFKYNEGRSREVYYNRRMQRVFSVQFSGDSRWVLSGSDEGNIRLWKANASEDIGTALPREQRAKEYRDKLKARFAHMPEIRRISRHRNVPKSIHKATIAKRGMLSDNSHALFILSAHISCSHQGSRRQEVEQQARPQQAWKCAFCS
jgi:WD repeat and SOF domain-containing protein 1